MAAKSWLPALSLALLVWAAPAAAVVDAWSDSDVESAERYRAEERERAERYRARVEAPEPEAPAAQREPPRARSGATPEGLGERIGSRLRAWLEGVLEELVRALAEAFRAALAELFGVSEPPATPHHDLAPRERGGFGAWLRREQGRAEDWIEGRAEPEAPPRESVLEWQQRENERQRERAKREAEAALERTRRATALEREEQERARWQESWHDADSFEAVEQERAARQREAAAAWEAEERARLESGARD